MKCRGVAEIHGWCEVNEAFQQVTFTACAEFGACWLRLQGVSVNLAGVFMERNPDPNK
jgi:hypothetical protein